MGYDVVGKGDFVIPILVLLAYYLGQAAAYFNMSGYLVGDLGRELYAPLRAIQGQVVYRDYFWLYGPLSLWINEMMYRLFSVNTQALYYLSLIMGLVIAINVYRLCRFFMPSVLALLVALVYIKVAMFGFTWQSLILPGKFASLWGVVFSFLFLNYLIKNIILKKSPVWVWVGLLGGMAVITKIDYAFAMLACTLLGIAFLSKRKDIPFAVLTALGGILVVTLPVIGWMVFNSVTIKDVVSNVFPVYSSRYWLTHRKFYDFGALVAALRVELAVIIAMTAISIKMFGGFRRLFFPKIGLMVLTVLAVRGQNSGVFKFGFMWPFFILSLVILGLALINWSIPQRIKYSLLVITVFNVLLTMRDKLAVGSFSMIFPFLVIVGGLLAIYKYSSGRIVFNYRTSTVLLILIVFKLLSDQSTFLYNSQYSDKKTSVSLSRGSFVIEPAPDGIMFEAVSFLAKERKPIDKMVSFPMEAAIPFLTQIQNPLPYDQFANGLIRPDDQKNVISSLNKYRPRFITVSNYEFLGYFGLDYNQEIYEYVLNNYEETARYGCQFPYDKSAGCTGYGIKIFELKNGKV